MIMALSKQQRERLIDALVQKIIADERRRSVLLDALYHGRFGYLEMSDVSLLESAEMWDVPVPVPVPVLKEVTNDE